MQRRKPRAQLCLNDHKHMLARSHKLDFSCDRADDRGMVAQLNFSSQGFQRHSVNRKTTLCVREQSDHNLRSVQGQGALGKGG